MKKKRDKISLYASPIKAGFPSPASDYIEGRLDLNEHLVRHPAATFFLRVSGDSMTNAGIFDGDILVVDRAIAAENGRIVIAVLDGEFTVKRLGCERGEPVLIPENPKYKPLKIATGSDFRIWGVVTYAIHRT